MENKTKKMVAAYGLILFSLVAGVFLVGCGKNITSTQRGISNWNLIHAGMPIEEVVELLGRPPQVFNRGKVLVLWYPSGLSEKELNQPGLQVTAYVVTITNGVVEDSYVPHH
jgi:hypothetical protein